MSIQKFSAQLDKERIYTDTPIYANEGRDMMANINAQYEMITNAPAPGTSIRDFPGHTHNSDGNGRGILRCINGACYIVSSANYGPPASPTIATASWVNVVNGVAYYASSSGDEILGIAYVSPGIEYIRVAACFGTSSLADTPSFRVFNITDSNYSSAVDLTSTNPTWYTSGTQVEVDRDATNRGLVRRIEIGIEITTATGTSTQFDLYHAYPYEYTDASA